MSDKDEFLVEPPKHWLKYLTKAERENVLGRGGNFVNLYTGSISEFLSSRFKYLYVPLTEKEWKYWIGVIERVEKQIEDEQ